MSHAAVTPLQDSRTPLSAIDPRIQEPEDLDAWEYEYSNTETEVCSFGLQFVSFVLIVSTLRHIMLLLT
jgi:hypothetical protein